MSVDLSEGDINQSPRRKQWQEANHNSCTKAMLEEDAKYFLHQALSTPCLNVLDSCEGSAFTDIEGRRILDFHGNAAHQVGYRNSSVIEAIKQQLDTLPFSPRRYTNSPAIELAKRLTELAPMEGARLLFAPGGAEANSMALQLARQATGRHKTISWWESFHGGTLDTISIGGEAMFRRGAGPLMPGAIHVPPPGAMARFCGKETLHSVEESVAYVDYVMEHEGDVAAFIAEPIRCTVMIHPPVEYWRGIREVCDKHGALLIFDEIPVGLGRSGYMFCCEYTGVQPDIVCLGKGLGGGIFPLAAMIARENLNVAADRAIGHFTHEKNPVACAAGLAALRQIEERQLVAHARSIGKEFKEKLNGLKEKFPIIKEVRGMGLLLAVEFCHVDSGKPAAEFTDGLMYACLERGLNFKVSAGNVVTLTPPLTLTNSEIDEAIDILDKGITSVLSEQH